MLLQFSVANFLCFKDEATLSLIATSDDRHPEHIIPSGSTKSPRVLRAAGIYGANGHGKTKFVEALACLERILMNEVDGEGVFPIKPFAFSKGTLGSPSRFEISFRAGGKDYDYGLVVDDEKIHEEWLFVRLRRGEAKLFERVRADKSSKRSGFEFGSSLKRSKSPNARFKMEDYLEFLATSIGDNQPFLAEASLKGVALLNDPFGWFRKSIFVIGADAKYSSIHSRARDEEFLSFLSEFVRDADTGINCLELNKQLISSAALEQIAESVGGSFLEDFSKLEPDHEILLKNPDGGVTRVIEKDERGQAVTYTLVASHMTEDRTRVKLDIGDESAGTQRLIDLLPMMSWPSDEFRTFVIDELDRKLHPLLAYEFIQHLLKCSDIQVIFTTHNTLLLDLELLRRDEIWFVQKRKDLGVELYSLAEFKVRPDLDIRRGYLNGRFGAIPFLGNLRDLGWCESNAGDDDSVTDAK